MAVFPRNRPILMAIVGPEGVISAGRALRGGADLVQVRAKELTSRDLTRLVLEVIAEVGGGDRVMVNSRPDIAQLTGAGGVHLPESGLDPKSVRQAFPCLIIGVSRHDRAGLENAIVDEADYAILGPVLETPGKEGRALGVDRFSETVRGLSLPVLAVGGLTPENSAMIIAAGARGIAAIRPFADAEIAGSMAQSWRSTLDLLEVR